MRILGIESSCDETACAVVDDGLHVRSNTIASQHDLHEQYRGVVPEIASRAHVERFIPTLRASLRDADCSLNTLDAIAVGNRPGLIGSLLVGVAAAKALALSLDIPIVGVDHIHAHLWAGALETTPPTYPALGLVVSGGHTAIFRCESPVRITRIGTTIDDAIGEAYDKAAVVLGLPYPGGPEIDRMAQLGDDRTHQFPISALDPETLNFSYSGLKTALLYAVRGKPVRIEKKQPSSATTRSGMIRSYRISPRPSSAPRFRQSSSNSTAHSIVRRTPIAGRCSSAEASAPTRSCVNPSSHLPASAISTCASPPCPTAWTTPP